MDLYPSIDILEGKVVRLLRGDYSVQTTYDGDPVAVARRFDDAGARWIHVVDLDAARDGGNPNIAVIEAICAVVGAQVQTGGGVRTVADASERMTAGVARVVVGSAAVEHPEVVDELATLHPGKVAVGLDARGRDVAIHGWTTETGLDLIGLAQRLARPGVAAIISTDIGRDGTLEGPSEDAYGDLLDAVDVPIIASGGVGRLDDLRGLDRRLAGVIVGRAIYENRFSVEEGIAACLQSA